MAAGTGVTSSTSLANVIKTTLSRARDLVEKPTVLTDENCVTKVMIEDGDGLTYNWPKFGDAFTAQSLSEGQPINNPQTLIPSTQQFTTSEVGVMTLLTDKAVRVTKEAMWARAGRFCGNAMRRRKETDMIGLFAGLSRDLGSAGNPLVPGAISAAKVRLITASESGQTEPVEDMSQVLAALHPFGVHDFLAPSGTIGSNIANSASGFIPIEGWTQELVREYDITRAYGVNIAQIPLIAIDGSDDAISAIFHKMAFLFVGTSVSMRAEKDRDITLRATMLVMTSEYGVGELEDQWGFKYTHDATAPTG